MDAAELGLLAEAVSDAVTAAAASGDADVDDVLAGLGWLDMLAAEPRHAAALVFRALGTANAAASALDDVLAAAMGLDPGTDRAVLLPPFAASGRPGRIEAGVVRAEGLATTRVVTASTIVVVCDSGSELRAVTLAPDRTAIAAVRGVDPNAGFHTVRVEGLDGAAAESRVLDPAAWEAAVAGGRRALAHQVSAACRSMLDVARAHAVERVQFDRPIARFQAVRHRLAETLVAIETLNAAVDAADDDGGRVTAALAKATAGRTARTVVTHCQQVLAGIGFTTEHAFHRFAKRTMVLDGLLGSADAITVDLGRELLAARHVPTLIEL